MDMAVLLVADEPAFAETVSKRLARRNFIVIQAPGGAEAIEVLDRDKRIDVVILDVKMPEMDGMHTLREIKRLFPMMEVIMLTGHGTVESAIQGMRLGAFDYLTKPCNIDKLVAKVQEAVELKRMREGRIIEERVEEINVRRGI